MLKTRLALILCAASSLSAQSRVELLGRVADPYRNANTIYVKGTATARMPGTSWQVS